MIKVTDPFAEFRESHVKQYRSTSDEVWGRESQAYCAGCNHSWPCDTARLLEVIDKMEWQWTPELQS